MTANFSVSNAANALMFYQWQENGTNLNDGGNISGSATSTLTISNVTSTNIGTYSVILSNAAGVLASSNALLTIVPSAPVIVQQPTNQSVLPGAPASFSVAAVGNTPYFYQWQDQWNQFDQWRQLFRRDQQHLDGQQCLGRQCGRLFRHCQQHAWLGDQHGGGSVRYFCHGTGDYHVHFVVRSPPMAVPANFLTVRWRKARTAIFMARPSKGARMAAERFSKSPPTDY